MLGVLEDLESTMMVLERKVPTFFAGAIEQYDSGWKGNLEMIKNIQCD